MSAQDVQVAQIMTEHADGHHDEAQTRERLFCLALDSGVDRAAARTYLRSVTPGGNPPNWRIEELRSAIAEHLWRACSDPETAGYLDLNLIGEASFMGWARARCKFSALHHARSQRAEDERTGIPASVILPSGGEEIDFFEARAASTDYEVEARALAPLRDNEVIESIIDALPTRLGTNDRQRDTRRAEAILTAALDFSPAIRLPDYSERSRILAALEADPTLARRSLAVWKAQVGGEPTGGRVTRQVEWLLPVWDDQLAESADALVEAPAKFAHTLAYAANQPRPRPRLGAVRRFTTKVKRLLSPELRLSHLGPLVETYLANEYELTAQKRNAERLAEHHRLALEWDEVAASLAELDPQALGATVREIADTLDALMRESLDTARGEAA